MWTEQLDEFDRSGKWTDTHKTQNNVLLQKTPKFVKPVMEVLARDHYRYRDNPINEGRLATLCYLTIYANTHSVYTMSRGFLFEFKMCPGRTGAGSGRVMA